MAFEARLVRGNPHLAPHVASGDLAAGEIVVRGGRPTVVHPTAIANGATGSVAIHSGEWELTKDGTSGPAIAVGEEVAWIEADNLATDVITGNVHFGPCTVAGGASSATVVAFLDPAGLSTNDDT